MSLKQMMMELGINVGMSVGGFFGSLLLVGKQKGASIRTQMFSILAGTLSANYITPLAVNFAMAFIVGFSGLRLVETISERLHKKVDDES